MPADALSPTAFETIEPGTPLAIRLTSGLENQLFRAIMDAVARAAAEQVEQLNASGHRLEPDPDAGPLAFRGVLPGGAVLTLDLQVVGSVSARFLSADEYAESRDRDESPEEARFYRVLEAARSRAASHGIDALSAEQRRVYVLGGMEAELQNGGFEQYFLNSAGDHAAEALAALQALGAPQAARVLKDAMRAFAGGPPEDRGRRELMVAGMPAKVREKWDALSVRYVAHAEPIAAMVGEQLG